MTESTPRDGFFEGTLAVKPEGTLASLLPWPKRWVSCDLEEGLTRIYRSETDLTECLETIHLPGSEYTADAKEPLQFAVNVNHPTIEQYQFKAECNDDYTMWIDTMRACGSSSTSRKHRHMSSTTSYSSRSSLVSRSSSYEGEGVYVNGDEIDVLKCRLQSLEESVYTPQSSFESDSLTALQSEVVFLKQKLECYMSSMSNDRKDFFNKEKTLEGEKVNLMEKVATLKAQNDKLAEELTSEQHLRYKHSLELAQQMCVSSRKWEKRYNLLSLNYLKLQTYLHHIDAGYIQSNSIPEHLAQHHVSPIKSIIQATDCGDFTFNVNSSKPSVYLDHLGFRNRFDSEGGLLRYICQNKLPKHISNKLETSEALHQKWVKFLDKNNNCLKYNKESKSLCYEGVPDTLRPRVWKAIITSICSKTMRNKGPGYYNSLLKSKELSPSDKQITLDLHRSFPRNIYFNSEDGTKVPILHRVLLSFSLHNKAIGYCQGMNMIAGLLIFYLDEETAFWGLVAILEHIMPTGYYNTDLLAARADQDIFLDLVEQKMPCLAAYLKQHDIDLSLFSFNWFMTIFIDSLPIDAVIRLWDIFLLEGHKSLFRISLALVKLHEFSLMQLQDSVSIFNMFRGTARQLYDAGLVIEVARKEFHPFPKRKVLEERHHTILSNLQEKHAANERQWREKQQLKDTVDGDTWDIVPTQPPVPPPSSCILHCTQSDNLIWVSHVNNGAVYIIHLDIGIPAVVVTSNVVDTKVQCMVQTSKHILIGTANGYVMAYCAKGLTKEWSTWVMDCVLGLIVLQEGEVLAHLSNGSLVKFQGVSETGLYSPSILDIGTAPLRSAVVVGTELWCCSGSTLHVIDLSSWVIKDNLQTSTNAHTQIQCIVAYTLEMVFLSVRGAPSITLWHVRQKMCVMSHDCSPVFLPPPCPKMMRSLPPPRMSIHSLFWHTDTNTFWIGTTHGHVLIYDVGEITIPIDTPYNDENSQEDDEASVAVLSEDNPLFSSMTDSQTISLHQGSSAVQGALLEPPLQEPTLLDRALQEPSLLDTSIIMVHPNNPTADSDASPLTDYLEEAMNSSNNSLNSAPSAPRAGTSRFRTNTFNEYDAMEDHCEIIESPGSAEQNSSPLHVYHAFRRYDSQEHIDLECDAREAEFEVIAEDTKLCSLTTSNSILTLNAYQILSSDPIAYIGAVTVEGEEHIMTCGGPLSQEGAIVLWRRHVDKDKVRWQAKPVVFNDEEN